MKTLTYRISKYPKLVEILGRDNVDKEIHEAFQVWENATDLTFSRKSSGKVHIEIRFESREHGDGDAFDGEGGTLAHVRSFLLLLDNSVQIIKQLYNFST